MIVIALACVNHSTERDSFHSHSHLCNRYCLHPDFTDEETGDQGVQWLVQCRTYSCVVPEFHTFGLNRFKRFKQVFLLSVCVSIHWFIQAPLKPFRRPPEDLSNLTTSLHPLHHCPSPGQPQRPLTGILPPSSLPPIHSLGNNHRVCLPKPEWALQLRTHMVEEVEFSKEKPKGGGGITRKVGEHAGGDRGGEVLLPEGGEPVSEGRETPTEITVLVKAKHMRKSRVTPLPSLLLLCNGVPLWLTWLSRKGLCDLKKKIVEKILKNLDPIGKRISQLYSSTHILLYKHP